MDPDRNRSTKWFKTMIPFYAIVRDGYFKTFGIKRLPSIMPVSLLDNASLIRLSLFHFHPIVFILYTKREGTAVSSRSFIRIFIQSWIWIRKSNILLPSSVDFHEHHNQVMKMITRVLDKLKGKFPLKKSSANENAEIISSWHALTRPLFSGNQSLLRPLQPRFLFQIYSVSLTP